ncbi:unnamed protein product [Urochloa humidicola]
MPPLLQLMSLGPHCRILGSQRARWPERLAPSKDLALLLLEESPARRALPTGGPCAASGAPAGSACSSALVRSAAPAHRSNHAPTSLVLIVDLSTTFLVDWASVKLGIGFQAMVKQGTSPVRTR